MNAHEFFTELDARVAKYDLLCHPFYKAWSAGTLTREDLREYALDYHTHVGAFPEYLAALAIRQEDGDLLRAVLGNLADEMGQADGTGEASRPHADLWMDFAEAMGAKADSKRHAVPEIRELVHHFDQVATEGATHEALAAFYAYESQVPRVATEKERGLRAWYGADDRACAYFTLHRTADLVHSHVWARLLEKQVGDNPVRAEQALTAAENAAGALWHALDGIEARRQERVAA